MSKGNATAAQLRRRDKAAARLRQFRRDTAMQPGAIASSGSAARRFARSARSCRAGGTTLWFRT